MHCSIGWVKKWLLLFLIFNANSTVYVDEKYYFDMFANSGM